MSTHSDSRQLVVFTLAGEHYALGIQQVQEIIRYSEPRSVASPIEWLRGVISLRGRIVPVYDVGIRIGRRTEVGEQSKIVIVEIGSETAGVIVDAVEEVLTVAESQVAAAPTADASLIAGIVRLEERLVALLTLDSLVQTAAAEQTAAANELTAAA